MANTKLKLMRILEILQQYSSKEHPLTTMDICGKLEKLGMHCERRTLYKDIKLLKECGYDIVVITSKTQNLYYCRKSSLSFAELKILMDAAKAASFITEEQTREMIGKLAHLGGSRRKELLASDLVNFGCHKHNNAGIYDSISVIESAISSKQQISFYYFDLNEKAERVYRYDKKLYVVEPVTLIFNHDNYYLRCYNPEHDNLRNYRVDRMEQVEMTEMPCSEKSNISAEKISEYLKQTFSMYSGDVVETLLEFKNELLDVIFDKFGESTPIVRKNQEACVATVRIQASPTFWGWYFQFPDKMRILSPDWLVDKCEEWRNKRYEE